MFLTSEQDAALAILERDGMIPFSAVGTVLQLNALRDLCKRGVARFARFSDRNCGYVRVGHSFLDDASETSR